MLGLQGSTATLKMNILINSNAKSPAIIETEEDKVIDEVVVAVSDEELEGRTADVVILVEVEEEGTADLIILVEVEEEGAADVVILVEVKEEGTADVAILDVMEKTAEIFTDETRELDVVEVADGSGKEVASATDSLDVDGTVGMAVVGFGVSGAAVGVLLTFKSFTQQ